MKELIEEYIKKYKLDNETKIIKDNKHMYPFSYELDVLIYLLENEYITYEEYKKIEKDYELKNKYLYLYDMAPRTFGETWGEDHISEIVPELKKETKEHKNNFVGEYDLYYDNIRIEVKACRANKNGSGSLSSRAYNHNEAKENDFAYHFQQLKPDCCDINIWIGVCKDELLYWVLTSDDCKNNNKFCSQHRNEKTGKIDEKGEIYEGQIFLTEQELEEYEVDEKNILKKIKELMKIN